MNRLSILFTLAFAVLLPPGASAQVEFGEDIMPILAERCFACHGPDAGQRKADLRLDLEDSAKAKVVVPGNSGASELVRRISSTDPEFHMPPPDSGESRLSETEIELIRTWIENGAPWSKHWAFEPATRPEPPGAGAGWARNAIDRFVYARLKTEGLEPASEASPETLIRRLSFDLRGLPPTLDEIDAFLEDESSNAYENLVDHLLESAAYGEHMAAAWLDGARYADTNGYQNDFKRNMWPWRNWVVDAFNDNMPFDQFVIEQIGGDLLPNATQSQRVATGFNRNNRSNTEGGSIEAEWRVENIVDRVETTSTVMLGLTMGCARCHDHKFDPVSQKEFYSFFAFFNSTADKGFYEETRGNAGPVVELPEFDDQRKLAEFDARIAKAQGAVESLRAEREQRIAAWRDELQNDRNEIDLPEPVFSAPLSGEFVEPARYGGSSPQWTEGLLGTALELDGAAESHVNLGRSAAFHQDKPFSLSIWARPSNNGALLSNTDANAGYRGVAVLLSDDGEVEVYLTNTSGTDLIEVRSDMRLAMDAWSNVCVTYDGSSKASGVAVYVNGVQSPLTTRNDKLASTIQSGAPLRLGRSGSGRYLKGAIADFRYYDDTLSAEDVSRLVDSALRPAAQDDATEIRKQELQKHLDLRFDNLVQSAERDAQRLRNERSEYVNEHVPTVMVMEELETPRPTYRLVRGAYDAPDESETLEPAVPAFLPPLPEGAPQNRLGLAQWLVSEENPLTARVTVNRIWRKMFGRGIVSTVEDFGVQGARPTHPQLLDWLASEFVATGWDVKALQKTIVMSATYRQSSSITDDLLERDPENRLLARGPRFRLPAEAVRDNALAISGLLVTKIGGPSIKPYQSPELWAELAGGAGEGPYVQSTGDDLYRRSLYIYRKRTVPPPALATFDAPSWELCRVRRSRTNTPLQALALLNDVTYVEAARHLGQRMIREGGANVDNRVAYGFRLATGRDPEANELRILTTGVEKYLSTYENDSDAAAAVVSHGESEVDDTFATAELAAYSSIAGVILNLDETITKE